MIFPVVILAGGKATRLGKITKKKPKSLININNRPFLYYQLSSLEKQGVKNVFICVGHFGFKIKNYLKKCKFNLNIRCINDGKKLLGTGGAIMKILPLLTNNFFIMYGDSYFDVNFSDIQKKYIHSKKMGLITVYKNNNKYDKSNVFFKSNNIIYDKFNFVQSMNYIEYGLSILNKKSFMHFKSLKIFDLGEIFNFLSKKKLLSYKIIKKRFYEIGSSNGINETKIFFKNII